MKTSETKPMSIEKARQELLKAESKLADATEANEAALVSVEEALEQLEFAGPPDPDPDPDPAPEPGVAPLLPRWTVYVMQAIWQAKTKPIKDTVLAKADGINIRVKWRQIEPSPGRFELGYLREQLARCEQMGKYAQLTVLDFDDAPSWLGNFGAESLMLRNDGRRVRCYPHWDQVVQDQYRMMVRHLVESLPFEQVTHWHCPGADNAETHFNQFQGFYGAEFSHKRQTEGYYECVRALVEETDGVPGRGVIASMNMGDYKRPWVGNVVVRLMGDFGGRVGYQMNSLSAKTQEDYEGYRWVKDAAAKAHHAGFEQLGPSSQDRYGGTLEESLRKAEDTDAQWIQVYQSDLEDVIRILK